VIHITTLERTPAILVVDQVPRGTGTSFMWDDHGHIAPTPRDPGR
jgi:hypothetical protein